MKNQFNFLLVLILELIKNKGLCDRMSDNNRKLIKEFDMEGIAKEYLDYCRLQ